MEVENFFMFNSPEHPIFQPTNVKMPLVGIYTFISKINVPAESLKANLYFSICSFYEQFTSYVRLS